MATEKSSSNKFLRAASSRLTGTRLRPRRRLNAVALAVTIALPIALLNGGCGQKGPLYIPDTELEEEEKNSG